MTTKVERTKLQLRYIFTVEIWPISTCLIPNFSDFLPDRRRTSIFLETNRSFFSVQTTNDRAVKRFSVRAKKNYVFMNLFFFFYLFLFFQLQLSCVWRNLGLELDLWKSWQRKRSWIYSSELSPTTVVQLSLNSRSTIGQLLTDNLPTVGGQLADCIFVACFRYSPSFVRLKMLEISFATCSHTPGSISLIVWPSLCMYKEFIDWFLLC